MLVTANTVVGIQARTSSSRFPGKVLELISGKPLIEWVVSNCQLSGFEVFVLTSNHPSDSDLVSLLVQKNFKYYRGDLNDVLSRFLNFMETNSIDKIIRISADSPLIHPSVIKKVAEESRNFPEYDLITNVYPRTYPQGQSVEVISKQSLKVLNELDLSKENREHVTSYFYEHPIDFRIHNVRNEQNLESFNLCVDEPSDLQRIQKYVTSEKLDEIATPLPWNNFSKSICESTILK
jgi:spore coat polysaccharide biosynthesis protein SpsF